MANTSEAEATVTIFRTAIHPRTARTVAREKPTPGAHEALEMIADSIAVVETATPEFNVDKVHILDVFLRVNVRLPPKFLPAMTENLLEVPFVVLVQRSCIKRASFLGLAKTVKNLNEAQRQSLRGTQVFYSSRDFYRFSCLHQLTRVI